MRERECIDSIIKAIVEKAAYSQFLSAFSLLSQKRNELADQLELLLSAVRDLIVIKKSPDATLVYYYDRARAEELSSRIGIQRLFDISDSIFSSLDNLSINANISVLLSTLMSDLKKQITR